MCYRYCFTLTDFSLKQNFGGQKIEMGYLTSFFSQNMSTLWAWSLFEGLTFNKLLPQQLLMAIFQRFNWVFLNLDCPNWTKHKIKFNFYYFRIFRRENMSSMKYICCGHVTLFSSWVFQAFTASDVSSRHLQVVWF